MKLYKPVHDRFERFCKARAFYDMPYQDLINETLLIAFKKFHTLKEEGSFLSFLIAISKRILANARNKRKPRTLATDHQLFNYADQDNQIERLSDSELLYGALAKLPEKQQEAIILYELTGFSIKEIMEIQQSSESAVKQRLRRGRQRLAVLVKRASTFKMKDIA